MDERGTFLPRLAVQRPVTVIMSFLALLVLGAIAYTQIPLQLLPSGYTPPFLFAQIPTRPAPPKDVEETIAIPMEEVFGTVRNVHRQRTWVRSSSAGFLMEFKEGTDMDEAYNQVRDRIERKLPDLPTETTGRRYFIWKYNPNNDPVFWMGATLPDDLEAEDASFVLENRLVRKLERVPGVSRVEVEGAPGREIYIEIDDKKANAAGIGVYDLIARLQRDNFTLAGGVVEDSGKRYPIRIVARYTDLAQVRAIPIAANGLTLGDVAKVGYTTTNTQSIYRVNTEKGVILKIFKESQANTVEVCRAVREVIAHPDAELARFEFIDFFDQGYYIEQSLNNLKETTLWGGLFAVLILYAFLRQVRITSMITLAIPLSLLVTLVVMYFTGSTLNVLSLMGLMLSVGMVVDNAIVVVENIQRARADGLGPKPAAIYGAGEVALAIVVATSTTIVVFLPLILMSGSQTLSFYLGKIGYPVCISLVASLFVGLIFIPLAAGDRRISGNNVQDSAGTSRVVRWLEGAYGRLLALSLRRRFDTAVLALLMVASIAYPMNHIKETDVDGGNPNDYRLFINFPNNMTFEERNVYLSHAEQTLWNKREELGIRHILTRLGGNWGRARLRIFLQEPENRPTDDRDALIKGAKESVPVAPGVVPTTNWGEQAASDAITVQIKGPDSARLEEIGFDIARRLRSLPGVLSAEPETDDESTQELQLEVQRELAQQRGLSPLTVGASVDFAIRGRRLNDFHAPDREVPMVVLAPEEQRSSLEQLENFALRDPTGNGDVPLGTVTTSRVADGYSRINRSDRQTVLNIVVTAEGDDLRSLGKAIERVTKDYPFPRGYTLNKGDRFQRIQQNNDERNFALSLAVLFVFLLMGVLFESFVLPFSIVVSIPFAFVGVYWVLFLTGTPFDVMAGVGLVILIGLVVNNAVVLIDLVNLLRERGMERNAAMVEAGRKRLRPILMTALTTIFGLLPMAVGSASLIGIPYSPLGRALIGGLVASTILTLFIVPLCYTLFDDLQNTLLRLGRHVVASLGGGGDSP